MHCIWLQALLISWSPFCLHPDLSMQIKDDWDTVKISSAAPMKHETWHIHQLLKDILEEWLSSSNLQVAKFNFLIPHLSSTPPYIRRRQWHPTPVLLPGKSHGWRSFVGWSPWGRWELDMTQSLHFHFSLSCIGEGNGSSLQCFCLENPRDGGAWWAAVYGVTLSRTRLKRLSSLPIFHI